MTDMERRTFCAALSRYGAQAQITVLADLNACSKERIEEILREAGEPLPKKHGRQKRTEE
nr:MAG TPA: hypothetical protein [Caudoviricetes sp.]